MIGRLAMALGILAFVATGTAHAQGNACAAAKLKAAGGKAACLLGLESGESKKAVTGDPLKFQKCRDKESSSFAKAEAKALSSGIPCSAGNGDASTIEGKVDAFVDDVVGEIAGTTTDPPPLSGCDAAEIKAAGKKAKCLLGLESGAAKKGITPDPLKVQKCKDKLSSAYAKAELKPPCTNPGLATVIEGKVDAFVTDVQTELVPPTCAPIVIGQQIPGTYVLNGDVGDTICTTNAAANRFQHCTTDADCGGTAGACLQLPWVTADGQIMGFPTGVQTVFNVAAADSFPTCEHQVCIPCGNPNASCGGIPGCEVGGNPNGCIPRATQGCCDQAGFIVPTFFVNILGGLCSRVDQIDCGVGVVNTSNPQTGDNEVLKQGDTSDPGPDCIYNTGDDPVQGACTLAGQGADYAGKITSTIGDGNADVNGIHYRLTTPELSTTWTDGQSPAGTCANGSTYDDGELLVSQLILKAQPTTAGASGAFVELGPTGSTCKRAGAGFIAATNPNTDGPITVGPSPGPLRPQSYDGMTPAVSAAVSIVFSGPNSPIRDIGFVAITPQMPIATHSAVSCSCSPTAGCPE